MNKISISNWLPVVIFQASGNANDEQVQKGNAVEVDRVYFCVDPSFCHLQIVRLF
jgi:hypothetical protein